MQCADYHISLVDRGKFEQACQLCATAVLNKQAILVLEVVIAFIQDRVRASRLPCLCVLTLLGPLACLWDLLLRLYGSPRWQEMLNSNISGTPKVCWQIALPGSAYVNLPMYVHHTPLVGSLRVA